MRYYLIVNYNICDNKHGNLYFEEYCDVYFNNSHVEDWVVCAFEEYELGIDIEKIRRADINTEKLVAILSSLRKGET